jgi:hypothetical protein
MAEIKSFKSKATAGELPPVRIISMPLVAAAIVLLGVTIFVGLDGCSDGNSHKTNVSSTGVSPSGPGSLSTPTPALKTGLLKNDGLSKKKSPVVHRAGTVGYSDNGSGVSFRYPRNYTLMTPEKAKENSALLERVPMNFVQPGGEKVATIALPGPLATSLLDVNINKSLSSQQCEQFADPDAADVAGKSRIDTLEEAIPTKVNLRGIQFTRVENGTQQTDTRYYHHFENGACYEFVLAVAEAPENKVAVDHFELFDNLERIMASVQIKSETPASVTASVPAKTSNDNKPQ